MFPKGVWNIPFHQNSVYLTFDDGPTPGVTDKLLDLLLKRNIKATFFCLGKNAEAHPELIQRIAQEGHTLGHHSYSHINGWKTRDELYFADVEKASERIRSQWFRPPYGKIRRSQMAVLSRQYKVIMWSLMPGDFDPKMDSERCARIAVSKVRSGDIVVLHDNIKSFQVMLEMLPIFIDACSRKGLKFERIEESIIGL